MMSIFRDKKIPSIDVDKTVFDIATEDNVIKALSKYMDPVSGKSGDEYLSRTRSGTRLESEFILPPSSKFRIDDIDRVMVENRKDPILGGKIRHIEGMKIQQFASGGHTEDTVPALLTPGEFVINRKAAQSIGLSRLHKLNHADKIPGFNKGGPVGVQKFADGGETFGFADNISKASAAAESAMDTLLSNIVAQIARAQPGVGFDDVRR
jgi:hypothetical protein